MTDVMFILNSKAQVNVNKRHKYAYHSKIDMKQIHLLSLVLLVLSSMILRRSPSLSHNLCLSLLTSKITVSNIARGHFCFKMGTIHISFWKSVEDFLDLDLQLKCMGKNNRAKSQCSESNAFSTFLVWLNSWLYPFLIIIIYLLKDNCFTELCYFLSNISMNQP